MSSFLSDEHMDELKAAFDMFDQDGNGISIEELEHAMRSFGKEPSKQELEEMMARVDEDGSGTIDFEEFVKMMSMRFEQEEIDNEL